MDATSPGGRWGTVAALVMRRPGLSVAAKSVYADMATYSDRQGWVWIRQETIASDLERSRAWVHAAIIELEAQGLIQHERQFIEGRQRASRYRLLDGLPRGAVAPQDRAQDHELVLSEEDDSAVQPADTKQHEGFQDSLSARAREPMDQQTQVQEVPSDWVPSADDVQWARTRHPALDVLAFTESFILSCQAKGYRYACISSAWRRWLTEPKGKLPLLPAGKPDTTNPEDRRHNYGQQYRASSPAAAQAALLADNAAKEDRILERVLGRRTDNHAAGHPG